MRKMFINGAWSESPQSSPVIRSFNGETVDHIPDATDEPSGPGASAPDSADAPASPDASLADATDAPTGGEAKGTDAASWDALP